MLNRTRTPGFSRDSLSGGDLRRAGTMETYLHGVQSALWGLHSGTVSLWTSAENRTVHLQ